MQPLRTLMMSWLAAVRRPRHQLARSWLLPTGAQRLVLRGSGTGDLQEPRAYRDVYEKRAD